MRGMRGQVSVSHECPGQHNGVTRFSKKILTPHPEWTNITVEIPAAVPSGEYLLRTEQIALHLANVEGYADVYVSCAQINVTEGGDGSPGPKVAFPGAYSPTDPGILIDVMDYDALWSY